MRCASLNPWTLLVVAAAAFALCPSLISAQEPAAAESGNRTYQPNGARRATVDKPIEQLREEERLFRQNAPACEAGDQAACIELGQNYEEGIAAPQIRPIAAILYSEACAARYAMGCYRSGLLNQSGQDAMASTDAARDFARACDLGLVDGCAAYADALHNGSGIEADRVRGEALLRGSCNGGSQTGCYQLGMILMDFPDNPVAQGEAVTLLVGACRGGELLSCTALIDLRRREGIVVELPHEAKVLFDACNAGDDYRCKQLGDMAMRGDGVVQDTPYALSVYDRACTLNPIRCQVAENTRAVPELDADCAGDDMIACARLGSIFYSGDTVYTNAEAAADLLARACRDGVRDACTDAGQTALELGDGPHSARAKDARLFLETGCADGENGACSRLAEELFAGTLLELNRSRGFEYYALLCERDIDEYCRRLEKQVYEEPGIALPQAGSRFLPPDDPERDLNPSEIWREKNGTKPAAQCVTNTQTFRGREYSDTVCFSTVRVIRGRALNPGDAPWQALVWRPERLREIRGPLSEDARVLCGGSTIRRGWVLTAAHCVRDYDRSIVGRGYSVRLGVHNPRLDEGITYPIITAYVHPNYDASDSAFDVALIRYDENRGVAARRDTNRVDAARTESLIGTIEPDKRTVEQRPIYAGMPVYTYGWGRTQPTGGRTTDALMSARMQLTTLEKCTQISGFTAPPPGNPRAISKLNAALCALGSNGESACRGDSGGPLIFYGDADRRPRVIGVVSHGERCGQSGIPGRYTRVGPIYPWIDKTIRDAETARAN